MSMIQSMQALRHFFAKHRLPEPDGIEFRFSNELDAHRFDAALKMDFDRLGNFVIDEANPSRVAQVCGFKIQPTFQKFGPPYSAEMLPAYHPVARGK